ncbi:unnamed protein product [Sphagnum jensenii]|uniref:Uncharacterized protein n=1 Tax=Sphagnum jensenii TaxID=128206 RepID=A0ABP1BJS3_9BRYO
METAVSVVPAWEYFSLMSLLTLSWLYPVMDFHLMADLLTGLRGDAIRLFHNPESKLPDQILRQCRILKERQLYITPDGGTIALDWLISSKAINEVGITCTPHSSV